MYTKSKILPTKPQNKREHYFIKTVFFLLEGAKDLRELTIYVFGDGGQKNQTRLEKEVLSLHPQYFTKLSAEEAWKKNLPARLGKSGDPDRKARTVVLEIEHLIDDWAKKRKEMCYFDVGLGVVGAKGAARIRKDWSLIRETLVKYRRFVFHHRNFQTLFTVGGDLILPSIDGIIQTCFSYAYAIEYYANGKKGYENENPDNYRELFKIYFMMRLQEKAYTLRPGMDDLINMSEQSFFEEHAKTAHAMKILFNDIFKSIWLSYTYVTEPWIRWGTDKKHGMVKLHVGSKIIYSHDTLLSLVNQAVDDRKKSKDLLEKLMAESKATDAVKEENLKWIKSLDAPPYDVLLSVPMRSVSQILYDLLRYKEYYD